MYVQTKGRVRNELSTFGLNVEISRIVALFYEDPLKFARLFFAEFLDFSFLHVKSTDG